MLIRQLYQVCTELPAETNAFFIDGKAYSYQAFWERAWHIRNLVSESVKTQGNIGFLLYDDLETYASVFGILWAGGTFVPINPHNPADRNALILQQAGIKTMLTSHAADIHHVLGDTAAYEVIPTTGETQPVLNPVFPEVDEKSPAYILFTSGSTGVPKGVPISHYALNAFIDAFFALGIKMDKTDKVLQMFDMTFDLSIMSYFVPLTVGACVYTVPPGVIKFTYIYQLLEEEQLTFALMVPSILTQLRPYFEEIQLPALKYSQFCGEALYADIVEEWAKCVPNALIQNVYGPTEATIYCLTYDCVGDRQKDKAVNGIVCIGKPMQNMQAIVADEAGNILPKGERGELCLAGAQLTLGYWNNPEKNAQAFFQIGETTYYRTGDIAYEDESGDFFYAGRLDSQIKIQGFRVELSEIEHHVREATGLRHVAAVTYNDSVGNLRIHLYLEGFSGDKDELLVKLRQIMPEYMIPSKITNQEAFPLNVNGKIDRKALQQLAMSTPQP